MPISHISHTFSLYVQFLITFWFAKKMKQIIETWYVII